MKTIIAILLLLAGFTATAQVKVGENPATIGSSSLLEIENTYKALVVTRVANTAAVALPVNGMVIYDISSSCLKSYENGAWTNCLSNGSNINPSTNGSAVVSSYSCSTASAGTLNVGVSPAGVTQTITAQVTQIGTYSLNAIVNGIVFMGSGSFTATGAQSVVLTATGLPVLSGIHNFVINTVPACSFSRNVIDLSSNGTAGIASFSCATASARALKTGMAVAGVTQTITATVTIPGTYSISTTTANGVTFSGSGTVAAGSQDIILTAAGTPTAAVSGTYILNTTPNCSFTRTAVQASSGGTAVVSAYNCSGAATGTMTIDTEITAASGVTQVVTAAVTTIGSYNITVTKNGVTFAAAGTFTVTGNQSITLTATGIPAVGEETFFPLNTTPTCSFTRVIAEAFTPTTGTCAVYNSGTATVGGESVTISGDGLISTGTTAVNCGFTPDLQGLYGSASSIFNNGVVTYTFSKPLKNIQVLLHELAVGEGAIISASLSGTAVPVIAVPYSSCSTGYITQSTTAASTIWKGAAGASTSIPFNISTSGSAYDKIVIKIKNPADAFKYGLMLCNASVVTIPSSGGSATVSGYDCTGIATGTMTAGTSTTDAGVTQGIMAAVTTVGTYNITTAPVNGITWSGSGTFTGTGAQVITLTASGTPVATETTAFQLPTTPGCGFSREVTGSFPATVCSTAYGSYPQTLTIGSSTVSVTKTGTDNGNPAYVSQCGVSSGGSAVSLLSAQSVTYAFGVPLKNVQVYGLNNESSQGSEGYRVEAFLGTAPVPVQLVKSGGSCQGNFTTALSGNAGSISNTGSASSSGIVFNISANSAYDKITIARVGSAGSANSHSLMFCNATAVPDGTTGGSAVVSAYSCSTASAGNPYINTAVSGVTQTITATVTTPGTYSIATDTVDGIKFYGSGTFTGTGAQEVILTASGIPTATGSKAFTLMATPDCSFNRTVGNSPSTNGSAVVSAYSCATASAGSLNIGEAASGVTQTITAMVTTVGTYDISTTANGVTFAGAGTFEGTGEQAVVLTAGGTPSALAIGTYALNTMPDCSFTRAAVDVSSGGTAVISAYSCTGISAGSLNAGALANGVTQAITATVTAAGSYSITTDTVDGVSFYGSGTFAGTGEQEIVLTAAGTPVSVGDKAFTLMATPDCSFNRTVGNSPSTNGSAVVTAYNCSGTSTGTLTRGNAASSVFQTITATATTAGTYNIATATLNGITWTASGSLSVGANTITLVASGTPAASGTNSFALAVTPTCSFTRSTGEPFSGSACGTAYGTYPQTLTIGSSTVSVTKAGSDAGSSSTGSQCGISTSGTHVLLNNAQSVAYAFGVPLRNVQVYGLNNESGEGNEGYRVEAFLGSTPVAVQLAKFGSCESFFTTTQSGNAASINNMGSTSTSAVVFNISSSGPYDKVTITRMGSIGSGANAHSLMFCNAVAVPNATSGGSAVVAGYNCSTGSAGNLYVNNVASGATQTITATVTAAGTYSITTNTVNGITFSGSGTFPGTGSWAIPLTASGTPTSTGSKTFTLSTPSGCSFNRTVGNSPSTNGTGVVSGFACSTGSAGSLTRGNAASGVTQTITATVTTAGTYNISATANGVTFANSGTFSGTGSRTITLTATGTPLAVTTGAYTINTSPSCVFTRSAIETGVCSVLYGSFPQTVAVGGTNVTITKTGSGGNISNVSQCGVTASGSNCVSLGGVEGATYRFNVPLNDVMVYGYSNEGSEAEGYMVTASRNGTAVAAQLVKVGGNCQGNFSIIQNGNNGFIWNGQPSGSDGLVFKISAASTYDTLSVYRYSETNNTTGSNAHGLMFCNATTN